MIPIIRQVTIRHLNHFNYSKLPKDVAGGIVNSVAVFKDLKDEKDVTEISKDIIKEYPEEPTTCCMSGCPNCVWVEYAEKLSEYYKDGGEQAIREINEKVQDENIKAFILHEIRMRAKKS